MRVAQSEKEVSRSLDLPRAIAEKVLSLLDRPQVARNYGAKGRARAAERFSAKRMVEEYRDLYLRLYSER